MTDQLPEAAGTSLSQDERNWGMFAHLSALLGFVIPIPFSSIIGPLVIWLVKKDEMPFVDEQGKEALNFQITMAIGSVICIALFLVVIGVFLLFLLVIFDLIMTIIATVEASKGTRYRYPFALRIIK
jgi:uncharacterized Tic20 family protein